MTSSDLSNGRPGREKSENKTARKGEPSVRLVSSRHKTDVPADRDADHDRDAMTPAPRHDDTPLNGHDHSADDASARGPDAEAAPAARTAEPSDKPAGGDETAPVEPAMVDRSMQAQLGQQLRALFDHVASEPLPDRLVNLLRDLESKEKKG
jgi:hypothetical protein